MECQNFNLEIISPEKKFTKADKVKSSNNTFF